MASRFSITHQNGMLQVALCGVLFAALLLHPSLGFSQAISAVNGKTFVQQKEGGKWFLQERGQLFEVNASVVTVKFKDGVLADNVFTAIDDNYKSNVYAALATEVIRENRLGFVDITVPPGKNPIAFAAELMGTGAFESVDVNTFGKYSQTTPDDTRFNDQWNMNNTGQTGGTVDADVDAPEAWDTTTGDPAIVVAVIDSGVEVDHEDLECNIWVNPGEDFDGDGVVWDTDDLNGIDDDGNGLIDDLVGWDFHHGGNDPTSTNSHGTHVAGIVAACGNNATGVMGVAGGFAGPGARLMVLPAGDAAPNGAIVDDAILYAADMGANIITMSLTVGTSAAIDAALNQAYNTDGLFINNASGNSSGAVEYPATNANVMAVGSTDDDDVRAGSSNFGPELEVVAPGVSVLSTRLSDTYNTGSGTSFASPHVAGLAALMLDVKPSAANAQVRSCIQSTAEDQVGNPAEDVAGRDNFYGFGRINAPAALLCIQPCIPSGGDGDDDGVCDTAVIRVSATPWTPRVAASTSTSTRSPPAPATSGSSRAACAACCVVWPGPV